VEFPSGGGALGLIDAASNAGVCQQWAFVDMVTGRITGTKLTVTQSAGDAFLTWIFPLHTGTAFGLPGRIVIALAGVALVVMMAAGVYMWWVKWRMRRRISRPAAHLLDPA
jgi:uncharacterized iron-regulated membrane protein